MDTDPKSLKDHWKIGVSFRPPNLLAPCKRKNIIHSEKQFIFISEENVCHMLHAQKGPHAYNVLKKNEPEGSVGMRNEEQEKKEERKMEAANGL